MRPNFDFVAMDDYHSDMRESADSAAHIIKTMRSERDFWRDCFTALLRKNGGNARIYIEDKLRTSGPSPSLPEGMSVEYYPSDMTHEFRLSSTAP